MKIALSVRVRLLALCLGLATIFACSSLVLGYLIERNQERQLAQQEQYRRFAIIETTQRALHRTRHSSSKVNNAVLRRDAEQERVARAELEEAREHMYAQLDQLAEFDPPSAQIMRKVLDVVPSLTERVLDAMVRGKMSEADPGLA